MNDFLATLMDPGSLPSVADAWRALEEHRRVAAETPWTQAVLRAMELESYQALPSHREGWVARRIGISRRLEERAIEALAGSGQIEEDEGRYRLATEATLDTSRSPDAGARIRAWSAAVGLERMQEKVPGVFSYNVFTVSREDLVRLRDLHLAYFRRLWAIVGDSHPADRVAVANVQLFALDGGPLVG